MTIIESDGKVTTGTIEYAAPSNAHMVMKTEGKDQALEYILYNGALYIKSEKQWVRSPVNSNAMLEQVRKDPKTLEEFMKTISGAQAAGSDSVGGKSASVYRYYQAGRVAGIGSSKGWVKMWVGSNGLLLKLESDAETKIMFMGGRSKSTILYTDYGAPIRISAPPV
jgi:hypothetical protein